ncbi:MAG: DUF3105 domain-containing protein [Thermoleophilaceae bacterium]
MASRKEQKEALRAEREQRELQAKSAEKRRKMIGIGAAAALVLVAIVAVVLVIALSGGDDGNKDQAADPSNADAEFVNAPIPEKSGAVTTVESAAKAANCTLKQFPNEGANHTDGPYTYKTNPPTSGDHFIQPAADGAYTQAPDIGQLVHELEHGRIILWFKPDATAELKGQLKSLFDEDSFHMVLVPNETKMPYEVAASAWTRSLTCDTVNDKTWDALRLFRDKYRDQGPEKVP